MASSICVHISPRESAELKLKIPSLFLLPVFWKLLRVTPAPHPHYLIFFRAAGFQSDTKQWFSILSTRNPRASQHELLPMPYAHSFWSVKDEFQNQLMPT
jgi:hypothetical protein